MSKVQFLEQLLKDFKEVSHSFPNCNESYIVSRDNEKNSSILTNNKNRLKIHEYCKKLTHYKQELSNKLQQVDLENQKFREQKISMATIINREISKMQKQDEDNLKELSTTLKRLIDFDQRLILELETVFEKYCNSIKHSQQTVNQQEVEAAGHAFSELEQQIMINKSKQIEIASSDFKLMSMAEYQRMILMVQESKLGKEEQKQQLFKNEQKINLMLSTQLEEKNQIIQNMQQQLQAVISEQQTVQQKTNQYADENKRKAVDLEQSIEQGRLLQQVSQQNVQLETLSKQYADTLASLKQVQNTQLDPSQKENNYHDQLNNLKQQSKMLQNKFEQQVQLHKEEITKLRQQCQTNLDQVDSLTKQKQDLQIAIENNKQLYIKQQQVLETEIESNKQLDDICQSLQKQILSKEISYNKLKQQYEQQLDSQYMSQSLQENQVIKDLEQQLHKYQDADRAQSKQIVQFEQKVGGLQEQLKQLQSKYENEILTLNKQIDVNKHIEWENKQLLQSSLQTIEVQKQQIIELQGNIKKQTEMNSFYTSQNQQNKEIFEQRLQQLEQQNADLERDMDEMRNDFRKIEIDNQNEFSQLQLEYNSLLEEHQHQVNLNSQLTQESKHRVMMLQRQIEQLELQKQSELLQFKIEYDKKQFVARKEFEQVKEVLDQSQQNKADTQQELINRAVLQASQKYEKMIQDLEEQYEKQLQTYQEQKHFELSKQGRNSMKPPRISQKSPIYYTNSPASSVQQNSFYKEVAKFSKDLDDSCEELPKRTIGGIKQNRSHIFIEDDHNNSTIQSQEQVSSAQNYSSLRYQFEQTFQNRVERCQQTQDENEDLFPPFDHRVCLRCKKNDMISPNFCKYKEYNKIKDLNNSDSNKLKSSRVMKEHIYGSNMSWRPRDSYSAKKSQSYNSVQVDMISEGINTILSLVNDTIKISANKRQSRSSLKKKHSESLSISFSSKLDTLRSNQ